MIDAKYLFGHVTFAYPLQVVLIFCTTDILNFC